MKKIIIRVVLGLAATGLIMANSVSAVQLDINTVAITADQLLSEVQQEMITQMQQEMINKNYSAMLLKDQMRSQMMAERTAGNFMQDSIQPVMVEKIRLQIKAQQVEALTIR